MAVSPYSHSTALLAGLSGAKLFAELVDRRRELSFVGETDILAPSIWICGSVSLRLGSAYFCRSRREANFPGSKVQTRGEGRRLELDRTAAAEFAMITPIQVSLLHQDYTASG